MSEAAAQRTYTVRQGDSLWSISKQQFGSGLGWRGIAEVNGILDPKHLAIGQRLRLPPLSRSIAAPAVASASENAGAAGAIARHGWLNFKYDLRGYTFVPIVSGNITAELKLLGAVSVRPAKTMEGLKVELSPKDWSLEMGNLDVKGDAKLKDLESLARKVCFKVFDCKSMHVNVKTFMELAKSGSGAKAPVQLGWSVNWESGKKGAAKASFSVQTNLLSMIYKYETTSDLEFSYGEWLITGSSIGYEIKITTNDSPKLRSILLQPHPAPRPVPWLLPILGASEETLVFLGAVLIL